MNNRELEELRKELSKLKDCLEQNQESEQLKSEINKIKSQLKKAEFRKKHSKLLKVTNTLEKGAKGFFKGIIKTTKSVGKALEKSDSYIAKQKAKEQALKKVKPLNKNEIKEALEVIE